MKIVVFADATGQQLAVVVPKVDLDAMLLMAARNGLTVLKVEDEDEAVDRVLAGER